MKMLQEAQKWSQMIMIGYIGLECSQYCRLVAMPCSDDSEVCQRAFYHTLKQLGTLFILKQTNKQILIILMILWLF